MTDAVDRFLTAVAARDWDALAACLAPDARLRMQSPGPLRDEQGPEAIAGRYRAWFGDLERFELREADRHDIADRVRVHYVAAGNGKVTDHTGYLALEDGRIAWLVMTCSGFREER